MARITGTRGNDALSGKDGDDLIRGLGGRDTLRAALAEDDPLLTGSDTLRGGKGADVLDVTGLGGNHTGFGEGGNDLILFGFGADTVSGGGGDDILRWSNGGNFAVTDTAVDIVNGGGGRDQLSLNFRSQADIARVKVEGDPDGIRDVLVNGTPMLTFQNIENFDLVLPAGANLASFEGSGETEQLGLGVGKHRAELKGGADVLELTLDTKRDVINMGGGEDLVFISYGSDLGDTGVTFDLEAGTFKSDGKSRALIENGELFEIFGNGTTADRIDGSSGEDFIDSGAGADTVNGAGGDDILVVSATGGFRSVVNGGAGIDILVVDDGPALPAGQSIDMSGTSGGKATIEVDGVETVSASKVETVIVNGTSSADKLVGLGRADTLVGGAGNDTVNAGGGADLVIHEGGRDKVKGGAGADTFVLSFGAQGADALMMINDFANADTLILDGFAFAGLDFVPGEEPAFASGAGVSEATGPGSQLLYNTNNGRLFLDVDGAGGQDPDQLARLLIDGDAAALNIDQIEVV